MGGEVRHGGSGAPSGPLDPIAYKPWAWKRGSRPPTPAELLSPVYPFYSKGKELGMRKRPGRELELAEEQDNEDSDFE